jgi:hypothetical protein
MKSNEPVSRIYATLKSMGRTADVSAEGVITFTDGLPPPSEGEWTAQVTTNKQRRTVTRARFSQCFTQGEKHDIFRRASMAAGNSPAAPEFAALMFWLITAERVSSDDAELTTALNLLESSGVVNRTRRNRIAEFKRPAN